MSDYRQGTIWLINFEPQVGTEIKKVRPGLIVSNTKFNLKRQKITVLPFTSQTQSSFGAAKVFVTKSSRKTTWQNSVKNGEIIRISEIVIAAKTTISHDQRIKIAKSCFNGLRKNSELIVIDPATFDKKRFIEYLGMLEEDLLNEAKRRLSIYLDLV